MEKSALGSYISQDAFGVKATERFHLLNGSLVLGIIFQEIPEREDGVLF